MKFERSWTESKFFALYLQQDGKFNDGFALVWYCMLNPVVGFGTGIAAFTMLPWFFAILTLVTVLGAWNGIPALGKLTPLRHINNDRLCPNGNTYDLYNHRNNAPATGSRNLAYAILDLPAEDQKLFPHDLVSILSADLLPTARYQINKALQDTLDEIKERNAQRLLMEQKAIYHEGVVAAIESAREHIQIETQTLKDYS